MKLDRVTPVILTRNEEPNLRRTLNQLTWAREILVVDSFSDDRTTEIASSFPQVRLLQRKFDELASQWTFAFDHAPGDWILALDADYLVPDELTREIATLDPPGNIGAYAARFVYYIGGKPIRGSIYPPKPVLFRRGRCRFIQDGHKEVRVVDGEVGTLSSPIGHDDRKPFRAFLRSQHRYMAAEAEKIRSSRFRELPPSGKVRKLVFVAPLAVLLVTLFGRGAILDGWRGLIYTWQRVAAELILSAKLLRRSPGRSDARDHEVPHH